MLSVGKKILAGISNYIFSRNKKMRNILGIILEEDAEICATRRPLGPPPSLLQVSTLAAAGFKSSRFSEQGSGILQKGFSERYSFSSRLSWVYYLHSFNI